MQLTALKGQMWAVLTKGSTHETSWAGVYDEYVVVRWYDRDETCTWREGNLHVCWESYDTSSESWVEELMDRHVDALDCLFDQCKEEAGGYERCTTNNTPVYVVSLWVYDERIASLWMAFETNYSIYVGSSLTNVALVPNRAILSPCSYSCPRTNFDVTELSD